MKTFIGQLCGLLLLLFLGMSVTASGQQTVQTEKEKLVLKFRQLTGADHVNLRLDISFEDTREELLGLVNGDANLTDSQKVELRKAAIAAYERLDSQLKRFINDQPRMTKLAEEAVFSVYDKAFSEAELSEIIAFYSSTTGQKALAFLPTISAQVQTVYQAILIAQIQQFIVPQIRSESDGLKKLIQEAKVNNL
jgi:uncharacterized protein